jgi:hypothetical protein
MTRIIWLGVLGSFAAVMVASTPAMAQQTTGTLGSPGATTAGRR